MKNRKLKHRKSLSKEIYKEKQNSNFRTGKYNNQNITNSLAEWRRHKEES